MNLNVLQQMASLINAHMRSEDYHVEACPGRPDQFVFGLVNPYTSSWREVIFRAEAELMDSFLAGYLTCAKECNP